MVVYSGIPKTFKKVLRPMACAVALCNNRRTL